MAGFGLAALILKPIVVVEQLDVDVHTIDQNRAVPGDGKDRRLIEAEPIAAGLRVPNTLQEVRLVKGSHVDGRLRYGRHEPRDAVSASDRIPGHVGTQG